MSIEIYYDRAFIKVPKGIEVPKGMKSYLEDTYVPILCHGSSNCFDVVYTARGSREIPEKNWSSWYWLKTPEGGKRGKVFCTSDDITEYGMSFGNPSSFGDLPFKSRHRQFKDQMEAMRWFCNGIKTAMTVERYRELGNNITVIDVSKPYEDWKRMKVTSTKDLVDLVDQIEMEGGQASVSFYGREIHRPKTIRQRADRKEVDHYFIIKIEVNGEGAFFNKLTRYKTRYSFYDSGAKKFKTEAQAKRTVARLFKKYKARIEKVEKIAIL